MSTPAYKIPRVAIVGRRNVGKSSLLNALCRRRYAITTQAPGLTRDILEVEVQHRGWSFFLCDTPGLDVENPNSLEKRVLEHTQAHLRRMDMILLVLAAPVPHPFDLNFIDFIRKNAHKTPFIFVVNKVDNSETALQSLIPFYEVGLDALVPVSARGRWNLELLLTRIGEALGQSSLASKEQRDKNDTSRPRPRALIKTQAGPDELKIAIIGRRNAGKSSLFNRFLGENRALVSEIPGTTRDSLDTLFHYNKQAIRIIDTAGMQRPGRLQSSRHQIEFYGLSRTKRSIREAQIVIQVVDGLVGLTDFDKRICSLVQKHRCAILFAISKWDALKKKDESGKVRQRFEDRIAFLFPHIRNLPVVFCSAFSGHGIKRILDTCLELNVQLHTRITTAELNAALKKWQSNLPPGSDKLKVLYATQMQTAPPGFIFFVNDPRLFLPPLRSYFANCIRKQYKLKGIPLDIHVRRRTLKS